ncbi:hypothetical protein ES706_04279 [subsurface metagenome]
MNWGLFFLITIPSFFVGWCIAIKARRLGNMLREKNILPSAFSLGRYEYYYSEQNDCYNTAPLKQATANIFAYIKYIYIKITNSKTYCGSRSKNTKYEIEPRHTHIIRGENKGVNQGRREPRG